MVKTNKDKLDELYLFFKNKNLISEEEHSNKHTNSERNGNQYNASKSS